MTYRVRNIAIAVALGLVAALLTSFYVSNFQRNVRSGEENVPIYVAARDIPAGTSGADIVRRGLLEKSEIVRRSVVPGAISSPAQLEDLVATQTVHAGEQVTTRRFATPAERGIRAQLKGTMRAYQVAGNQHQLLAGTLKTGDRVDVVASLKDLNRDVFRTRIVLRDIEVLRAAGGAGATDTSIAGSGGGLSVLLAVTDTQVQKLFHVTNHGDWSLDLRPPLKANDSPETVADAGSIMRAGLNASALDRLQTGGDE